MFALILGSGPGWPRVEFEASRFTFTYSEARRIGLSDRQLYRLRDEGAIEVVSRGLFRRTDLDALADVDLLGIGRRAPLATLCLTSALARHGLTDDPATIDVALPRGTYRPVVPAPVTWHLFDPDTFEVGRTTLPLDEQTSIGLYDEQRSIIDAARLRHREGSELVYGALRRPVGRPTSCIRSMHWRASSPGWSSRPTPTGWSSRAVCCSRQSQQRWTTWLRKLRLADQFPLDLTPLLASIGEFADPVFGGEAGGRRWNAAYLGWVPAPQPAEWRWFGVVRWRSRVA